MHCNNCDEEIDDDSKYCQFCGTEVIKPTPPVVLKSILNKSKVPITKNEPVGETIEKQMQSPYLPEYPIERIKSGIAYRCNNCGFHNKKLSGSQYPKFCYDYDLKYYKCPRCQSFNIGEDVKQTIKYYVCWAVALIIAYLVIISLIR